MTLCGDVIDAVDAQLVNAQGGVVEPAPIFAMLSVHNFELGNWSAELVRYSVAANPANQGVLANWQTEWQPLAERAVTGLATIFGTAPHPKEPAAVERQVAASVARFRSAFQP
jgi:hypothetical protein